MPKLASITSQALTGLGKEQWGLVHVLDNPNAFDTSANDNFGISVAISGNRAIVGASNEDDAGGASSGKAYIFSVNTGTLIYTLDNPNPDGNSISDGFGSSVDISNFAIVGARQEDENPTTPDSGKAYIYNTVTGNLSATLNNPNAFDTAISDQFGFSVAISGDRAIVGAPSEDDAGGSGSGKAYIINVNTGAVVHTLDNPNAFNTSATDGFGISVAISGNLAIVGASNEDDAGGINSGKAYIFNVTSGALERTLDNPNAFGTSEFDQFGASVAISGDYAAVGAYAEDDAGGLSSGKVYVFNANTGALVYTLDNPNPFGGSAFDQFGFSIAMDTRYLVAGASEDDAGGLSSGKAYIYDLTTGTLVRTLSNPNRSGTSASDSFGRSVAISGDYVLIGAPLEGDAGGTGSGKVYVFKKLGKTIGPNLLVNGDFSTGDFTGWTADPDAGVINQQAVLAGGVFFDVFQSVPVYNSDGIGVTYYWSIDVVAFDGTPGLNNRAEFVISDDIGFPLSTTELIEVKTYSGQLSTSQTTTLTVTVSMNNGVGITVDNIQLRRAQ